MAVHQDSKSDRLGAKKRKLNVDDEASRKVKKNNVKSKSSEKSNLISKTPAQMPPLPLIDLVHNFLKDFNYLEAANAIRANRVKGLGADVAAWERKSEGMSDLLDIFRQWEEQNRGSNAAADPPTASMHNLKRKASEISESESDSKSASDDGSDSDSSESSSSSESDGAHKKAGLGSAKTNGLANGVSKSSSSTSSSSESGSEDESGSSSSGSESSDAEDSQPAVPVKKAAARTDSDSSTTLAPVESDVAAGKNEESSGSSSDSTSSSDTDTDTDSDSDSDSEDEPTSKTKAKPAQVKGEVLVYQEPSSQGGEQKVVRATEHNFKMLKKQKIPYSRIPDDIKVEEKFSSNAYQPYDYANKAYQDLSITKGKGFTKAKQKGKRGSYKGGMIDTSGGRAVKFDD